MKFSQYVRHFFHPKRDLVPVFEQQATYLCKSSESLCRMLENLDPGMWKQSHREIRSLEQQGDALLTEIRELLSVRPLKPGYRANVTTVAMSMDDCLDVVKDASHAVLIYDPHKIDPQLAELAQYILSEARALRDLLPLMLNVRRNIAAITLLCDRITELEHEADEAYETYIGYIFSEEEDVREMTKYKNLAELFEKATDSAKHVADCIRLMLLRYDND